MKTACCLLALCGAAQAQVSLTAAPGAEAVKGGYFLPEEAPAAPLPPATEALLKQINAYRAAGARCGAQDMPAAGPLVWNLALEKAAGVQVQHMARIGDVTHAGSDGSGVGERITRQGYTWGGAGENAAAGNQTGNGTLAQWMASPGHCRNLMGAHFRDVAVARQDNTGSSYKWYWVMVLARPMSAR